MMVLARKALIGAGALALSAVPALALDIQDLESPAGQSFWLVQEPSVPIVAVEIGFEGGSNLDPAGLEGIGRFTMGMMNEGSGTLDAVAYAKAVDDVSARIGFDIGRDGTEVSGRFLTDTLDEGIALMALALSEPRFDADPIERVRNQILSGLRQNETDPDKIAGREWFAAAYPGHPYGRPSEGTPDSIGAVAADDLRAAHQRLLTRSNASVAIVGDIDPARAGAIVDTLLAGLPDGAPITVPSARTAPPPGVVVIEQDVPQSVAIFGHVGLERDDPDFITAYVMNYILGGGGFSSRLTEEVREKRGLAYSVYSYLIARDGGSLYMGGVQTANERIAESIEVIRGEWARMASGDITESDLAKAKTYLTGSFPLRFDSNSKIANYLLFVQREDLGIDYIDIRNGLIDAVTLEDINRVAARVLQPDALSVVVVGKPVGL
ncbi:MAG: pitrilysin family protein [Pseudomonadota bacterium]